MAALPESGELLEGKYRIERVIGEGAWGEVLEATNVRIKRRVAIKVLKSQYASNPAMVTRFEREALASTHIESPHVVQIFDAGVLSDGRPYMVMEFLVGDDLGKRIENARGNVLPVIESIGFTIQAARGLAAAHGAGILHRDMKPSNIVIAKTKSGREVAKIVDFGISKLLNDPDSVSNTQTGTIMGSPVYMSPEQARGSKASDHRSDIYSLGVVLYECVTGRTPFVADSFNELLFKIALEEAPSPKSLRPDIDDDLNNIILKATARTPEARYQTAVDFENALFSLLEKSGNHTSADWATDTGGRGINLQASPTRNKSIPEILLSPVPGDDKTPKAPASLREESESNKGKETGTSLSKTQDPLEPLPVNRSNKKVAYVAAAAALVVLGVIGLSSMRSNANKPDLKPATSVATTADPIVTAKPSATTLAPATTTDMGDSSVNAVASADSGTTATSATVATAVATTVRPVHVPTTQPSAPKATPTATSSVGGRTIRVDF